MGNRLVARGERQKVSEMGEGVQISVLSHNDTSNTAL